MDSATLAADPVAPSIAGGTFTLILAVLAYLGTRKSRPDQAAVLIDAATKLATTAADAEMATRTELAALRTEVTRLAGQLDECEERHIRTEAALAAAGIILGP